MRDRLEEAHLAVDARPAEETEYGDLEPREGDVDRPETTGGVPDRDGERLELGAGQLRLQELAPAYAEPREDGEGEGR